MGQTLTNGIFLPNEGERNCYEGLAGNWRAIDGYIGGYNVHIADAVIHVSQADRDKWDAVTGKADASALTAHTGDTTIHVTAADKEAWNGKADASALAAHTGDTTIHVTAADKEAWNGKADASALTAHTGDTTIHVTAADKEAWNGKADASALTAHTGNTTIHVTAADKQTWDAVTGKANNTDVLHKTGDETKAGNLTVTELNATKINSLSPGALSLPDLTAGVDISSYITTGSNDSTYTPPANGYIAVRIIANGFSIEQDNIGNTSSYVSELQTSNRICVCFLPVMANIETTIRVRACTSILYAKFFPCLGNI